MLIVQRLKDLFNLNIPIGRLRYFIVYLLLFFIVSPLILFVAPNILLYEGDETLVQLLMSGQIEVQESVLYILCSILFSYTIEFFLDVKRLYDILRDKQTAVVIGAIIAVIGLYTEFLTPMKDTIISYIYLAFAFIAFVLMCTIKGKGTLLEPSETQEENAAGENSENLD